MLKKLILLIISILYITGCSNTEYTPINPHEQFVATINIIDPSVQFFSSKGEQLAEWQFEEYYTGGTLIQHDRLLMYGNQMPQAHIYEISTGKLVKTFDVEIGTTNAYYDSESKHFFMTNSETNKLLKFNIYGEQVGEMKLRNYPMSMVAHNGLLYVVNFKDTMLSVVNIEKWSVVDEWTIARDSHGIQIDAANNELWLGGHGAGTTPNSDVTVYALETGKIKEKISLPMMPIGIALTAKERAVISHGNSTLYLLNEKNEQTSSLQIGANPFAVSYFENMLIVAGYDDATLYFLNDGEVTLTKSTNKGPFQLVVREVE